MKETEIRHQVYFFLCAQMHKLLFKTEIESQQSCTNFLNPKLDKLLKCYPLGQHDAISNILCLALSVLAGTRLHGLKI